MAPLRPVALLCALAFSTAGVEAAAAQRGKTTLEPFLGGFAAAKQEALERNVPLVMHIILEGEPENDTHRDTVLHHAGLNASCARAVVLVANNGEHALKTVTEVIEGERVESQVCSSYPWFRNCGQHRAPWDDLYIAYHDEAGDLSCPQTILLAPDGSKSWRKNDANPADPGVVLKMLQRAQKAAGPGLLAEELIAIRRLKRDALQTTTGRLWGDAWRSWAGVLEITEAGHFAELARSGQTELEESMRARVAEIEPELVPGSAAAAYGKLHELRAEWLETPGEKLASQRMRSAERDPELRDEIRAWQREREARELLDLAVERATAKDEKGLKRALRKLFARKFDGTEAQGLAREQFPEHAPASGGSD